MNPSSYAVVACATAATVTAAAAMTRGQTPRLRIFIGGTIAAVILSAASGFAPEVVRGLATLIILSSIMGAGYVLLKPLTALVS